MVQGLQTLLCFSFYLLAILKHWLAPFREDPGFVFMADQVEGNGRINLWAYFKKGAKFANRNKL